MAEAREMRVWGLVLLVIAILIVGVAAVTPNTMDLAASVVGLVAGLIFGALTGGRSA